MTRGRNLFPEKLSPDESNNIHIVAIVSFALLGVSNRYLFSLQIELKFVFEIRIEKKKKKTPPWTQVDLTCFSTRVYIILCVQIFSFG